MTSMYEDKARIMMCAVGFSHYLNNINKCLQYTAFFFIFKAVK